MRGSSGGEGRSAGGIGRVRWVVGFILGAFVIVLGAPERAAGAPDVPLMTGNEPIASVVNPLNPQNVVVAQCSLRVSTDFGQTFGTPLNPVTPPGYPRVGIGCDDVLAFDSQGRMFWTYLLRGDTDGDGNQDDLSVVVVQVNPITGTAVGNAVDVTPGTFSDDKQWLAADAGLGSPFRDNLYVIWTRFVTPRVIMFSRSTDQGATWSAPQQLSAAGEGFVWPSHVAVAPNGDVYGSYHADTCGAATSSIFVIRDSTGGANLAAAPPVISQKTSFQAAVTCNVQTGAGTIPQTDFWMQGALAPYVLPDPVRPGHIYVVANDDPNDAFGNGDDGDVVLARSTNYGNSWSLSTISHAPAGTLQVFPNGAIDQNGRLAVFWYDTRGGQTNAGGNLLLDVYVAVSSDGGLTFSNDFRVNDNAFDPDVGAPCRFGCGGMGDPPPATLRIGEYNGIAAANGVGYAAWTGNSFAGGAPTGQQIQFDVFSILGAFPDRFEPNDAIQPGVATGLGAQLAYSEPNLTIHSDTDEDFFRVVAATTGKLSFEISSSGRLSDLDIQVRDKFNNAIATASGATDQNATETITIPAVAGEPYFLRVYASPGASPPPNPPPGPLQFPPLNVYNLNIVNSPAPVPFGLDLASASDSGPNNVDDLTNIDAATIRLRVDETPLRGVPLSTTPDATLGDDSPGFKVGVFRNGSLAGLAAPVPGQPGVYELSLSGGTVLTEGVNFLTGKVFVVDPSDDPSLAGTAHVVGEGGESAALLVTLDKTAPAAPARPDLVASSDSGGVSDDDITTITTPKFAGDGEPNTLVRILAGGTLVGQGTMTAEGTFEVTVNPLADGVYDIAVQLMDGAGNLSALSPPSRVTIANQSLTLPGATASGDPAGPVTVNLETGRISGFPGIAGASGDVGIIGIPAVNLAVAGQALAILGTASDDGLEFTPTAAEAGTVTRSGSGQVLRFTGAGGTFTIDPAGGSDTVTINGTPGADMVAVAANTTTTAQVNSLKAASMPIDNVENLVIRAVQGVDMVNVTAFDSVNGNIFVDGGEPTTNAPSGDDLAVGSGSPKARFKQQPGGPTPGSGAIVVEYPQTTGNQTRVSYAGVEKVKVNH